MVLGEGVLGSSDPAQKCENSKTPRANPSSAQMNAEDLLPRGLVTPIWRLQARLKHSCSSIIEWPQCKF